MSRPELQIVCVGEGMLELSPKGEGWALGCGGDTLNTAIHLARAGHHVRYLTALGTDPFSADLRSKWESEGLDTSLILTDPARGAGLYAITTDAVGERSFTYWRENSAARNVFAHYQIAQALAQAEQADLLCFSLISLAILPDSGRELLIDLCGRVRRRGGKVAFDGNYRPLLWESTAIAQHWHHAALACADFGLPTLEDEAALGGAGSADAVADRWLSQGCGEVVVKLGAAGCRLPDGTILAPDVVRVPIDTSGAGDAFNAGYLGARLTGSAPDAAARAGHALAGWTIMRPGAIPPPDA